MRVRVECYTKKITFPCTIELFRLLLQKGKVILWRRKTNVLAHTKWMCKYHIVFTPKYRRKMIYNQYREDVTRDYKTIM